jgi:hypothetical protein
MTILLRCQCGNRRHYSERLAVMSFPERPEGATEVHAEACHFCLPNHGHYECHWVKPAVSGQEGH